MATSVVATVKVEYTAPSIISQPSDWTTYTGNTGAICVYARGSSPLSYQWQWEGANIPGGDSCYNLYSVNSNSAGAYRVIVSNPAGSVTSLVARLTVLPNVPIFLTQPVGQDAGLGASVVLSASSTNATSFLWQFNGHPISNPDGSAISVPALLWLDDLQTNQAGNYTVALTNWDGAVTSRV